MNMKDIFIDYLCNSFQLKDNELQKSIYRIPVLKVHGSCNWLYCDNCRNIFHDLYDEVDIKRRAGFLEADFQLLNELGIKAKFNTSEYLEVCRVCSNAISSHIATFSYRKSFRKNSFPEIWNKTEKELSESDKWIFIGYSLPDSDYEFKHLLKIAELKLRHVRKEKLKIDVVLLDSDSTINKYHNFFGSAINYVCNDGIKGYTRYLEQYYNIKNKSG